MIRIFSFIDTSNKVGVASRIRRPQPLWHKEVGRESTCNRDVIVDVIVVDYCAMLHKALATVQLVWLAED